MNQSRGSTDDDLAVVSDNPEWTREDFERAKPFREVFPKLILDENGDGPPIERVPVNVDKDVVEWFRAGGQD